MTHVDVTRILTTRPGTSCFRRLHQVPARCPTVVIDYLFKGAGVFKQDGSIASRICYVYDVFECAAEVLLSTSHIETFISETAAGV